MASGTIFGKATRVSVVTLPFTPTHDGILVAIVRAATQGRVYQVLTNTLPAILDGYQAAASYINAAVFVETGKQIAIQEQDNVYDAQYFLLEFLV